MNKLSKSQYEKCAKLEQKYDAYDDFEREYLELTHQISISMRELRACRMSLLDSADQRRAKAQMQKLTIFNKNLVGLAETFRLKGNKVGEQIDIEAGKV
jgi:uncharacterized lipoprotein YehR (DUF1307 family)